MLKYKHIKGLPRAQIADILVSYGGQLKTYVDERGARKRYLDLIRGALHVDWLSIIAYYGVPAVKLCAEDIQNSSTYFLGKSTVPSAKSIFASVIVEAGVDNLSLDLLLRINDSFPAIISPKIIADRVSAMVKELTHWQTQQLTRLPIIMALCKDDIEYLVENSSRGYEIERVYNFSKWLDDPTSVELGDVEIAGLILENSDRVSFKHDLITPGIAAALLNADYRRAMAMFDFSKLGLLDVDYAQIRRQLDSGIISCLSGRLIQCIFGTTNPDRVAKYFPASALPLFARLTGS